MTQRIPSPPARQRPIVAAILLAVAAAAVWGSSRMTWVALVSTDGLTMPRTHRLAGQAWFAALTPVALVLVAALAAMLAVQGVARRCVGVLVAVVAAVAAVPGFALVSGHSRTAERAARVADLPVGTVVAHVTTSGSALWLSLVGAAFAFAAGVQLARQPAQTAWRGAAKYDNPVFRREAAAQQHAPAEELPQRVLWDALDAGADPTDEGA